MHIELIHDVRAMGVYRFWANNQLFCDLIVRVAFGNEL
jgi:hypothetical protein